VTTRRSAVSALVAFALALPATALAQKWGPHIDFEAKPGSKRTLGEGDLFVPLMQDERTLFFGNLRARFDDQSSREGNLGLGVRRMLQGGWNVGGYGYLDRRKSGESGQYYNQVTLGGEALGRDWEFRGNAYLPQGEHVRNLGTTVTAGASTASIVGSAVQVTTAGTTTTTSEERALKGYDVEVGWRVPLFDVDEMRQLRLYAGAYRFKDDVVKVSGPRLRAELTMAELPGLWPGAQLIAGAEYQDDNARGGQTFLSLRLRIPLGGEKERPRQLSFQERRMTAPVMRDVDIVTQARTASTTTAATVETATALADGTAFTILNSSSTPNLATAVAALPANSTALLSGTFNTAASVNLGGSKSLIAGTMTVRTPSGLTATLNSPATISSTFTGAGAGTIQAPGNNTISGLTINVAANGAGSGRAIQLNTTGGNYNILNNTIIMTHAGASSLSGIFSDQNFNVLISGNSLTLTGGTATRAINLFGTMTATVTGNTLNVSGATILNFAADLSGATVNAGSTGNTLVSGACNNGGGNTGSIGFTNGTTCP